MQTQDFTENMQSHRDNKNYLKWNLESTARVIQHGFLGSHIVVVRPSRYWFLIEKLLLERQFAGWNTRLSVVLTISFPPAAVESLSTHRCTILFSIWRNF